MCRQPAGGPRRALDHRLFKLILVAVLALAGTLAPRPAAAQLGGITGFVVDPNSRGINRATVLALAGPSAGRQAISAANGSYQLTGLLPGDYTFVARATGFADTRQTFRVLADTVSRLDFTLAPEVPVGGVLQGFVRRFGTTTPIPGAQVDIASVFSTRTVFTDETGFYRATGLATGSYRVTADRDGFTPVTRSGITVIEGRITNFNFGLVPSSAELSRLQGQVTDLNTGAGIPGARVELLRGISAGLAAAAGGNGSYAIQGIVSDTYDVRVSASGYQTRVERNIAVGPAAIVTLNVALTPLGEPTATIEGFVFAAGQGLPGARVEIVDGPDAGRFDITDPTGFYQFRSLLGGTRILVASATGRIDDARTVTVLEDGTARVDFTPPDSGLRLRGTLTGRVTGSGGNGVQSALVTLIAGPEEGERTMTDDDGDYAFGDLTPGRYDVRFERSGFTDRVFEDVEVFAGQITTLDAQLGGAGGTLTGTVRDQNNTLLNGVLVEVLSGSTVVASGQTNTSGRYTITGIPAGTYSVRFSRTGFLTSTITNVSIAANATRTLNATLTSTGDGAGRIMGRVRGPSGQVVQGADVTLTGPDDRSAETNNLGRFDFQDLPAGRYTLEVSAEGFRTFRQSFNLAAGQTRDLNITLQAEGAIRGIAGQVRNRAALPIEGATVTILNGVLTGVSRTTGTDGLYNFLGIPPGTYRLGVAAPGYRPQTATVRVFGGSITRRNFTLLEPKNQR